MKPSVELCSAFVALSLLLGCEESSSGAHREAALPAGQGATGSAESGRGGLGVGGTGTGGSAVTLTDAVARWALVDCERLYSCSQTMHDSLFADVEACLLAASTRYAWLVTLPGTGFSSEQALACAEARATQSCDEYFSYVNPPPCEPTGALPPGEQCLAGVQCTTTFCTGEGACGTCAAAPGAGAPCTSGASCSGGMRCSAAGKCAPLAKLGMPCGAEQPCDNWLICEGTCQRYPATVGATCGEAGCDFRAGVTCNQSTAKCASLALSAQSCGWASATSAIACSAQRTCTMQGSCEPTPGLGQACSVTTRCQYPLVCSEGKCAGLPTPDSCEP